MKITNTKILKHLDKMVKATELTFKAEERRQDLNATFAKLMDETFGAKNWDNVDFKARTFMTQEEYQSSFYKMQNPSFEPTPVIEDVEILESGPEELEEIKEETQH